MRGRRIRLSIQRRMVIDFLYFARAVPTVPVQKQLSIADLVAARAACRDRPRWTAMFVKAFALVAEEVPQLRRAYVKLPWPALYEYPTSKASIMIERDYRGEPALCPFSVKDPAHQPLPAIGEVLLCLEHPARGTQGISALEAADPDTAAAAAAVVVDRAQHRASTRQFFRHVRRVSVFGAQRRIAPPDGATDGAAQLRRHRQERSRDRAHHVRPPRDGRRNGRTLARAHGRDSQHGDSRRGPIAAACCACLKR